MLRLPIPHSRPSIGEIDISAVVAQLRSHMIAEGSAVTELEARLAQRYGFADAVVVGSGCQALRVALEAVGVKAGNRVALPTYVCPEVMGVVEAIGAQAVVADIGEDYLLDPLDSALEAAHAIVVPAILGIRADCRRYMSLGAPVIADWAQYAPHELGLPDDLFDIAILSFEATKLIAAGEGGAILFRDADIAQRARKAKTIAGSGLKLNLYPLSDLQASLACSQLAQLDGFLARRKYIAARYCEQLGIAPQTGANFRFVFRVPDAASLLKDFLRRGVAAKRPVDPPVHFLRPSERDFLVAEVMWRETISLPCYPSLSDNEISHVIATCSELLK